MQFKYLAAALSVLAYTASANPVGQRSALVTRDATVPPSDPPTFIERRTSAGASSPGGGSSDATASSSTDDSTDSSSGGGGGDMSSSSSSSSDSSSGGMGSGSSSSASSSSSSSSTGSTGGAAAGTKGRINPFKNTKCRIHGKLLGYSVVMKLSHENQRDYGSKLETAIKAASKTVKGTCKSKLSLHDKKWVCKPTDRTADQAKKYQKSVADAFHTVFNNINCGDFSAQEQNGAGGAQGAQTAADSDGMGTDGM